MADLSKTVAVLSDSEVRHRAIADKLVDAPRWPMLDDATNARFARIAGDAKLDAVLSPPTGTRAHVVFDGAAAAALAAARSSSTTPPPTR